MTVHAYRQRSCVDTVCGKRLTRSSDLPVDCLHCKRVLETRESMNFRRPTNTKARRIAKLVGILYRDGMSIQSIARMLGWHTGSVDQYLYASGIQKRSKGWRQTSDLGARAEAAKLMIIDTMEAA